jgi:hypothetical protein
MTSEWLHRAQQTRAEMRSLATLPRLLASLLLAPLLLVGCSSPKYDRTNPSKDPATSAPSGTTDAASTDAAPADAARTDAAPTDAAPTDAAPTDAHTFDDTRRPFGSSEGSGSPGAGAPPCVIGYSKIGGCAL